MRPVCGETWVIGVRNHLCMSIRRRCVSVSNRGGWTWRGVGDRGSGSGLLRVCGPTCECAYTYPTSLDANNGCPLGLTHLVDFGRRKRGRRRRRDGGKGLRGKVTGSTRFG